jgi:hypothetical protein
MGEWWYVIVILVLAVLIGLYFIDRQRRSRRDRGPGATIAADRNYVGEREDARQAGMSAEDRAWETASQQRNQDIQARRQVDAAPTPEDRAPDVV